MADHKWVVSRLGHGERMCAKCFGTNRELAALGELNHCSVDDTPESSADKRDGGVVSAASEHANKREESI